ncbi:six-cysteine ranthipeptide SCIFF [Paenibacillus sp.]
MDTAQQMPASCQFVCETSCGVDNQRCENKTR